MNLYFFLIAKHPKKSFVEYLQNIDPLKQHKLLLILPLKDNTSPFDVYYSRYFVVSICIFQFCFGFCLLFCIFFSLIYSKYVLMLLNSPLYWHLFNWSPIGYIGFGLLLFLFVVVLWQLWVMRQCALQKQILKLFMMSS